MDKSIHLIKTAFKHLNDYKRLRALYEKEYTRQNTSKALEHELDKYKRIDALELALRGLQSELHTLEEAEKEKA